MDKSGHSINSIWCGIVLQTVVDLSRVTWHHDALATFEGISLVCLPVLANYGIKSRTRPPIPCTDLNASIMILSLVCGRSTI